MSNITLDTNRTKQVAALIKIHIPDSEVDSYTKQLNTVLESVEVLGQLDTQNVPETSQTHGLTNILREDEPQAGLDMKDYKNTQNFKHPNFVVTQKVL